NLRFIELSLHVDRNTLLALMTHLPTVLHDLALDIGIHEQDPPLHPTGFNINTDTTTPMQLQRLDLRGSFIDHEGVLIPLLRRSPLLEHVDIKRSYEMAVGEGIIQALIEHCPNLQSFNKRENATVNTILLGTVCTLLEAYPNGLRSFKAMHTYGCSITPPGLRDRGALISSLLKYSACTIEVLVLEGNMGRWIDGIVSVMKECPNLKVLRIDRDSIPLEDLIDESRQEAATSKILKPTISGSTKPLSCSPPPPHPPALPPWVCTKLEELFLGTITIKCISNFQNQLHPQQAEANEVVISAVRKIGILWMALKSLKSLNVAGIIWGSDLYWLQTTMSCRSRDLCLT
ncbi:hypothetical protein BGZ65_009543, partial [Modicella reniformis]